MVVPRLQQALEEKKLALVAHTRIIWAHSPITEVNKCTDKKGFQFTTFAESLNKCILFKLDVLKQGKHATSTSELAKCMEEKIYVLSKYAGLKKNPAYRSRVLSVKMFTSEVWSEEYVWGRGKGLSGAVKWVSMGLVWG